jgi:hypothetical protein
MWRKLHDKELHCIFYLNFLGFYDVLTCIMSERNRTYAQKWGNFMERGHLGEFSILGKYLINFNFGMELE